jgi:hypothetical protein
MLDVRTKSKEIMTMSKGFKMVHVVVCGSKPIFKNQMDYFGKIL